MRQRVVVLGLDAASHRLLRAWTSDGSLPNLRALLQRGLSGSIAGLDGYYIGSTWPSFYTGFRPAGHGFHYQVQLQPGTYQLADVRQRRLVHCPTIWQWLSDHGKRVAVVDVPLAELDSSVNGLHVIEWGVHDGLYGFAAHPPARAIQICERFGAHRVGSRCDAGGRTPSQYRCFVDDLVHSIETKTRMTKELLEEEPWDLLLQVYSESHCVGHQCWHLHDPSHPAYDPLVCPEANDPLKRVFQAHDRAIGELVAETGDALVIVLSAHGMTQWYGAHFLLRDILLRLGAAAPRAQDPRTHAASSDRALNPLRQLWRRLPPAWASRLRPLAASIKPRPATVGAPALDVDVNASACLPIRNGLGTSGIRLNVVGREPAGVLQPGAELEEFVRRLTAQLLSIVDAKTRSPVVARVVRTSDIGPGAAIDWLPDLVIEWSRKLAVGSRRVGDGRGSELTVQSDDIGVVTGTNDFARTGEHEPEGFFIAAGPGVRPGVITRAVSVTDFAPTLAALLGTEPFACDGEVIAELLCGAAQRDTRA